MWLRRLRRYLFPGDIEKDDRFRSEINRLGHFGVQIAGLAQIFVTIFMIGAYMVLDADHRLVALRIEMGIALVLAGAATVALARIPALYHQARMLCVAAAVTASSILTWMLVLMSQYNPTADDTIPSNLTLIMLVAVATVPLRPADTLLLGFLMLVSYVTLAQTVSEWSGAGGGVDRIFVLFIAVVTGLATALTAVLYGQRRSAYEWHTRLRQSETRNLLAENAASVGRLAATLSHELNSPVGALVSGVDTLMLLAGRLATAHSPSDNERLVYLQNEVRKSILQSTRRLREIVARMQRFTNLDQAEVQSANLNELVRDAAALVQPAYSEGPQVALHLADDLPPLVCRPQRISAVFANLLANAFNASQPGSTVRVATSVVDTTLRVEIADSGHGLDTANLAGIFDPDFKVSQGRVAAGNWSMFSSRQIVREHGGDIAIESGLGEGTRVSVTLPLGERSLT